MPAASTCAFILEQMPTFRIPDLGLRRYAQIALALVALMTAGAAGYRYLDAAGPTSIFGEHLVVTPSEGPVGMRPAIEFPGFSRGRELTVYMCFSGTSDVADCAELGSGVAGQRMRSAPVPATLPDGTDVDPGTYALLAGPDSQGRYLDRGRFRVIPFEIGEAQPVGALGPAPSSIQLGDPRSVARGTPCAPPHWLADGRLAVGSTVIDPSTGTTIELGIAANELAWSPDGDKLAIITADRKEIRLAGPDGTDAAGVITESRGLLSSLSWSPEGDRLAFISRDDPAARGGPGPPTVRILNATTGETTSAGPGLAVAWAPRPELLAVEMSGGRLEASTPQGGRSPLTEGIRPSWSSDGRFLAVIRGEGADKQGFVMLADGRDAVALGERDTCALSFSPSGRDVAFVANVEGQVTLLIRPVTGGRQG